MDGAQKAYKDFALPGSSAHYARDKSFDVKHVKIELVPDLNERKIWGKCTTYLTALEDDLQFIDYDSVELNIKSVMNEKGENLNFEVYNGKLRIKLPSPVNSGDEIVTIVEYEARPRWGLFFTYPDEYNPKRPLQLWTQGEDENNRYWFPCYDYPNDKMTTEVIVTVPENFTSISNGKLIEVKSINGKKSYHWLQDIPHSSYLVSVVVGEFSELRDEYDGIPLLYYVPKGREQDALRSFSKTPDMIKFISEYTGVKYPYAKYAQVAVTDFIYGGMENISATTLTDRTLHDERAHIDYSSDDLVVHELAHQWFGDLITCRDWSHAWLNEGFATFFEILYKEHDLGKDEAQYQLILDMEAYSQEDKERYRRPIVSKVYIEPSELFDRHLYEKASLILNYFRYLLGEDKFRRAIMHYTRKFQQRNVETDDFRKAIEEATGKNLEHQFEQWFYKSGHPDLIVSYDWLYNEKVLKVTVRQNQIVQGDTPIFNFTADLAIVKKSGEREIVRVNIREKENVFYLPCEDRPLSVIFDPGNYVPKTIKYERPKEDSIFDLRNGKEISEKVFAARHLSNFSSEDVMDALEYSLMNEPFWGVRAEVAKTLGKIGNERAMNILLNALKSEKNAKARRSIVRALGEFKDERVADTLRELIDKDESYFVAAESAKSLGRTRSKIAFDTLTEALKKESYLDIIRELVFEGFAELADERAIPIAIEYTKPPNQYNVRAAAAMCMAKLGKGKREVFDHLTSLLNKDPNFRVRMQVCRALVELGDQRAIDALEKVSETDLDPRVRRAAREAIRALRESREAPAELKVIMEDIEKLRKENMELRARLESLEAKLSQRRS